MTKTKTIFDGAFDGSMKPMMILPVGAMKQADIKRLCDNGVCVVEAKDPAAVRFLDPIPAVSSRTKIEIAAIELSRKIMSKNFWADTSTRKLMTEEYVELLVKGTPLDPAPSQAEREKEVYDYTRTEEVRKIAREDARKEQKERAAKPATKPPGDALPAPVKP